MEVRNGQNLKEKDLQKTKVRIFFKTC